ncbi:MAG: hypothetical protein V2A77_02710 [Pseudomonadota bacterium]
MAGAYAKKLSDVVDGALRLLGQYRGPGRDGIHYSREEIRSFAWQTLLECTRRTHVLKTTRIVPLVAATNVYDLPNDIFLLKRVGLGGSGGYVLIPGHSGRFDLIGQTLNVSGTIGEFYKDLLEPGQIAVWRIPSTTGSTTSRDSNYGLLRKITDADGNVVSMDSTTGALRRVSGVPFRRSGTGRIVREVIASAGNLIVSYVRSPEPWTKETEHPDPDFPVWMHEKLRFGVAGKVASVAKARMLRQKGRVLLGFWERACVDLARRIETTGPSSSVEVM